MAGKEYILTKEPDALYEVTYILDAALGPGEGRDPGWADIGHAAEHYARRFGLSRAACEKWFTPLREIERHVIEGLGLSEEVLRRDYRAPNEALSTPSALVRLAMEHDFGREKLAALIYNDAAALAPGDEGYMRELTLEEFVRLMSGLDEHEVPPSHRWNMLDLCINWERRFSEISSVLRRGEELYREKLPLAAPLIDDWYARTKEALDAGGLDALFEGPSDLSLPDGQYIVRPGLEHFSTMTIVLDALLVEQGRDGPWPFISGLFVQLLTRSEAFSMLRFQDSLKAMADKKRLDILAALREAPRSSGELAAITGLSAATVTHHMQILLNARLVGFELRGARSIYSLNREGAEQLSLDLRGFLGV